MIAPRVLSLQELDDAGRTQNDFNDYLDVIGGAGSESEKRNYSCWGMSGTVSTFWQAITAPS